MGVLLLLASVITANLAPARGQIGAHYFESLNQSQVWINLEPKNLEPGPNPIEINVTVSFPGRRLAEAPVIVALRAGAYCRVFPTRIRQPVMTLIVDGAEQRVDGRELPLQVRSACGDGAGSADVIVTELPFGAFRRIAAARDVEIRAFGFDVKLTPTALSALASFASAVEDGVTITR